MPELPEVETVARQLRPLLRGKKVDRVEVYDARLVGDFSALQKRAIVDVYRLGKQVVLEHEGPLFCAVHLRMTGRLLFKKGDRCVEPGAGRYYYSAKTERAPRARWLFQDAELWFSDTRRFGTLTLARQRAELEPQGLEPLAKGCTPAALAELIGSSRQPLKQWLLRQDKIVGLGNIYASEILFAARLHPNTPASELDANARRRLHAAMQRILRRAIENCGTTFSDFQDSSGSIGNYQRYLKVYDREGLSCRRCKTEIVRIKQAGRSTYFCPKCQPLIRSGRA